MRIHECIILATDCGADIYQPGFGLLLVIMATVSRCRFVWLALGTSIMGVPGPAETFWVLRNYLRIITGLAKLIVIGGLFQGQLGT